MELFQVHRGWVLLAIVSTAGCALSNCASTGATTKTVGLPATGAQENGDPDGDRLSQAFEAPSGPSTKGNVPPIQTDETSAAAKAEFDQHLAAANRSLAAGNIQGCETHLAPLQRALESLGPEYPPRVFELHHRIAMAKKDFNLAQGIAERWLLSCTSPIDACRQRALAAWERALSKLANSSAVRQRIVQIRQSDACVLKAEASLKAQADSKSGTMPTCAGAASAVYQRLGDRLMIARLLLIRARLTDANPDRAAEAARALDEAQESCQEPRCAAIRRRALQRLAAVYRRLGRPAAAASAALVDMSLLSKELPSEQRPFARTPEVDRACELLDAHDGVGACRRLEKSLLGTYSFHDFSKERAAQSGLAVDTVRKVNEHFEVMIHDCLAAEAERRPPPALETYHLQWTVLNDGRVKQAHFDREEQEIGPLAECIHRQFAFWRYPRYRGEWQNIEQTFVVKARETQVAVGSTP